MVKFDKYVRVLTALRSTIQCCIIGGLLLRHCVRYPASLRIVQPRFEDPICAMFKCHNSNDNHHPDGLPLLVPEAERGRMEEVRDHGIAFNTVGRGLEICKVVSPGAAR